PDPGDGGCVLLALTGGDTYSVKFGPGDGEVTNKDGQAFQVKKPTSEGTCVVAPTTTTTSTTSTTTSSTTSTTAASPTTAPTVSTTPTTPTAPGFDGPDFPPVGGNVEFGFTGNSPEPGGANVSLFNFSPTTWTALYWGPFDQTLPAAGLDGS